MPLSEQEQRLLEEMERGLYQNDADFVATVSQRRGKPNYSILVVGVLVGVLGIGTLVSGVIFQLPILGVVGFVIMFGGVLLAVSPPRKATGSLGAPPAPAPKRGGSSSSFMDSLNDRWDRRQDGRE